MLTSKTHILFIKYLRPCHYRNINWLLTFIPQIRLMLGIIAMNILSTKEKFVYPSSVLLMMLFGMKKVRM